MVLEKHIYTNNGYKFDVWIFLSPLREVFFKACDISRALQYRKPNKAISDHVDYEDKTRWKVLASKSKNFISPPEHFRRGSVFINETGFFALCQNSRLPAVKHFKRWITSKVIPSIRVTEAYSAPDSNNEKLGSLLRDVTIKFTYFRENNRWQIEKLPEHYRMELQAIYEDHMKQIQKMYQFHILPIKDKNKTAIEKELAEIQLNYLNREISIGAEIISPRFAALPALQNKHVMTRLYGIPTKNPDNKHPTYKILRIERGRVDQMLKTLPEDAELLDEYFDVPWYINVIDRIKEVLGHGNHSSISNEITTDANVRETMAKVIQEDVGVLIKRMYNPYHY